MRHYLIVLFFFSQACSLLYAQGDSRSFLFIGSYTGGKPDQGLYIYTFNTKTGALNEAYVVDQITNPSFITLSPNGKYLYAGADTKMPDTGSVMSFRIDTLSGQLKFLNRQSSGGDNPVYLTVHKNGRYLVNGNYSGGSVSVLPINADGSLKPYSQRIVFEDSSIIKERQEKSHIHATVFSPQYDFIYLPDLGGDKIRIFRFDESLEQPLVYPDKYLVEAVPGSGPRHFTFHPNGRYAYSMEELSGMVSVYAFDDGELDDQQRIFAYSKPCDFYWSADIHVSPDGKFLYASNRREDENTIAIFSINQTNSQLTLVGHQSTYGDHPRNFTLDPTGNFLLVANMLTNNVVVFKRDVKTGLLKKTKHEIHVPSPSCLVMRTYH